MKKLFIIFSMGMLLLGTATNFPIRAVEIGDRNIIENGNLIEIDDIETGYASKIETIYLDNGINKYLVNEFGDTYTLLIDSTIHKVYINSFELSMDEYRALGIDQIQSSKNKNVSLLTLANNFSKNENALNAYEEKHIQFQYNLKNHIHENTNLRCTICPLQTVAVPTTNYNTTEYHVGSYETSEVISMTTSSITLVASAMTFGVVSLAKKLIQNLLATVGLVSVNALITYEAYQSFHNICPRAMKEKRHGIIKDKKTQKLVWDDFYNYFYSSRP